MNTYKLRHTAIEYARHTDGTPGYAWDYQTGCRHQETGVCKVKNCWARGCLRRHGDDFTPKLHPERLLSPLSVKKPSIILVNFKGDGFGDWVDAEQMVNIGDIPTPFPLHQDSEQHLRNVVLGVARTRPQHNFIFLTKNPQGYLRWHPFPDNCFLGFTACTKRNLDEGLKIMKGVEAKHKWISFEPLLESML